MTKRKLFFPLLTIFFIVTLWASALHAQTPSFVLVNYVATAEQEDVLGLSVFFTITDETGRPIPQTNINEATIQLLNGPNNDPVEAIVENPQTPVFIVLLIDGSGSMQPVIDDVRAAATSALRDAPPTARFAVIQFNETMTVLQDFTNDLNRVNSAINIVQSEANRGTCLYDSLYSSIDLLAAQIQSPQERRAIILFTDGQDQLVVGSDEPCSLRTYNDVINAARPAGINAPITPIHTIGLTDDQGGNLNEAELRLLAEDTIAFSVIGNQTNLGSLFQEIIDGLNSQLVAYANVYAIEGENQAALSVSARRDEPALSTTFNFYSDLTYEPVLPVGIQISSLQYDQAADNYLLSLSITNSEFVRRVIVNIWDVRRGVQVSEDYFFENPGDTLLAELNTVGFEASREYSIRIQALNPEEFLIETEKGETVLAEGEIVYEPPQAEPVVFTIQAVNANYETGILSIDLDVSEAERVQSYEGFIVDDVTGGKIHEFGPTPFTGGRIQETLPEVIQSAETPGKYRVTVYLTTQEELRTEAIYDDFSPIPPEPPGFMTRVAVALGNNPFIFGSILVIVLSIIGFFVYQNRKEKKQAVPIPRPPIDKTNIYMPSTADEGGVNVAEFEDWLSDDADPFPVPSTTPRQAGTASARLHLKVIQTPNPAYKIEKVITQFPCVIGREGCDINIQGDRRISRRHVEISVRGNEFFVTDLGSSNGTHIGGKQLPPKSATPIEGSQTIHLGSQTHIQLDPS